jgi:hypothetical protein
MWPVPTKLKLLSGTLPNHFLTPSETAANHEFYNVQTQSTWVDELVDAPEGPFKRGSHRRSASESMVFLDGHTSLAKVADENITEDEEFDSQRTASMHSRGGSSEFDRYSKMVISFDFGFWWVQLSSSHKEMFCICTE